MRIIDKIQNVLEVVRIGLYLKAKEIKLHETVLKGEIIITITTRNILTQKQLELFGFRHLTQNGYNLHVSIINN